MHFWTVNVSCLCCWPHKSDLVHIGRCSKHFQYVHPIWNWIYPWMFIAESFRHYWLLFSSFFAYSILLFCFTVLLSLWSVQLVEIVFNISTMRTPSIMVRSTLKLTNDAFEVGIQRYLYIYGSFPFASGEKRLSLVLSCRCPLLLFSPPSPSLSSLSLVPAPSSSSFFFGQSHSYKIKRI